MPLNTRPLTKEEKAQAIRETLEGQLSPATARLLGFAREARETRIALAKQKAATRRERLVPEPYKVRNYATPEQAAEAKTRFEAAKEAKRAYHALISLSAHETRTAKLFDENHERFQVAIAECKARALEALDSYDAIPRRD